MAAILAYEPSGDSVSGVPRDLDQLVLSGGVERAGRGESLYFAGRDCQAAKIRGVVSAGARRKTYLFTRTVDPFAVADQRHAPLVLYHDWSSSRKAKSDSLRRVLSTAKAVGSMP